MNVNKESIEGRNMENKVRDLRSALTMLKEMPGQLLETDVEVDPMAELAGVYSIFPRFSGSHSRSAATRFLLARRPIATLASGCPFIL